MNVRRIIPCLDIKDGRVVKGVNFVDFRDAGDPVECAKAYQDAGADEIVFLDISATSEERDTVACLVNKVAAQLSVPFSVGGGIRTVNDMSVILNAGADKVSLNSAAVKNPSLISEGAEAFGSQCIIVAIDAKQKAEGSWEVFIAGGQNATGLDAVEWAMKAERLGAGEILLTSMDKDGTKSGYDLELTAEISSKVKIPVIASGGAGTYEHFYDVLTKGKASAVLAASLFHFNEIPIPKLKEYLQKRGILVSK
ncbi:MAG: imidazole glycerol phosphate synthase subunit HisF [Synergistaceae bacterium]|nr:imidazole glycerol phosphate synthase subunit HisF [Synergistaceae bacterium]